MRRFVVSAFALSCLILVAACGDPAGPEDGFTFDPVPVFSPAGYPPISWDADTCDVYMADEVGVGVHPPDFDEVSGALEEMGFPVRDEGFEMPPGTAPKRYFLVEVPPGSVPDAVAFIAKLDGVVEASRNGSGPPPRDWAEKHLGCTPTRRAG